MWCRGSVDPSYVGTAQRQVFLLAVVMCCYFSAAVADVVVVANRTPRRIPVEVTLPGETPWKVTMTPGESRPIFADTASSIAFDTGAKVTQYALEPGNVYFIGTRRDGTLDLEQIGLGEKSTLVVGLPGAAATTPPATIPVKILVDDDQVMHRHLWEPMLRKRVAAASAILHRHAMVKLEVVAVDTWQTDNSEQNFNKTLSDFERQVDPFPGELAIGFSSQYELVRGRVHMGGTHGPLQPHILLREWSQHATESEKLELLLHELGHYLGAAHSPEPDSVMRPVLSDRKSRRTDFSVRYDPVNTLLMSMVGEELRRRRVSRFAEVSPATRARLQEVYEVLGVAQPSDPAARVLTGQLGRRRVSDPQTEATRAVLAAMTQAARTNQRLPTADSGQPGPFRVEGDALFEELMRLAARQAAQVPEEVRAKAFLLAIGIGIGDPEQLNRLSAIARVLRKIETPAEASIRSTYIGKPTARGRHDLARHFTVAALLVAAGGHESAESLSMAKEVVDSQGGTGFSFADLAADKAGIAMAQRILDGKLDMQTIAERFTTSDYLPNVADLPEGMTTMQFIDQYGGQNDERFQRMMASINAKVAALPAYRLP